jgi:pimeloyl-ACP methyl ester carboxylesterase
VERPEPRYATTADGTHIAYSVMGDGPIDLVYAFGYSSNIDADGEVPFHAAFRRKLASFARLILFDRRGTGLADRSGLDDARALEAGMDDIRAVMDAVGSERALLFAVGDGGMVSVLFAASHPDRVLGLVLWNPEPRQTWSDDYPWGWTDEQWDARAGKVEATWGSLELAEGDLRSVAPDVEFDRATIESAARMFRAVASPGSAAAIDRAVRGVDVRAVLPSVQVPTLVLHSARVDSAGQGRYTASMIPGAERAEIPTTEWLPFWESADPVLEKIRGFVKKVRHEEAVLDRVLATALAISEAVKALGLQVRAGLHTGEAQTIDSKVGGMAVIIGARVGALAGPSEVLVSNTVKDLVAGSDLMFEDAGEHELKGVPDRWRLYRAVG